MKERIYWRNRFALLLCKKGVKGNSEKHRKGL